MHVNVIHAIVSLLVFTLVVFCLLLCCLLRYFCSLKHNEHLLKQQKQEFYKKLSEAVGEEGDIKLVSTRRKIYEPLRPTGRRLRVPKKLCTGNTATKFKYLLRVSSTKFDDIPFLRCLMLRAYYAMVFHDMLVAMLLWGRGMSLVNTEKIISHIARFSAYFYDTQWLAASILGNPSLLANEKILQFIKMGESILKQAVEGLKELLIKAYSDDVETLKFYQRKGAHCRQHCEREERNSASLEGVEYSGKGLDVLPRQL